MTRRIIPMALGLAAAATTACGGQVDTNGLEEPIRVIGAQFRPGDLPGRRPLTAEQLMAGEQPRAPYPTPPESAGRIIVPSESGFVISGRATPDTYSIGFKLEDQGTGYWILPAGSPDPTNNDELLWRATLDFGPLLQPGLQRLLVAAIDEDGSSGTQRDVELCVRSAVTDNLNSCSPTREPPALVVSLGWGNRADLDLRIVASDGTVLSNAYPTGSGDAPSGGLHEYDANASCVASSTPRENIVWQTKPSPGLYFVYVNLQDACGEKAAPFVVSTHVARRSGEEFRQVETFRIASEMIQQQANGGSQLGLFVTEFEVN